MVRGVTTFAPHCTAYGSISFSHKKKEKKRNKEKKEKKEEKKEKKKTPLNRDAKKISENVIIFFFFLRVGGSFSLGISP